MWQSIFNVLFLLVFSAPTFCAGVKTKVIEEQGAWTVQRTPNSVVPRSLRFNNTPVDETFIRPFRFDQKLLICNAYPSNSPLVVRKNAQEVLADGKHAIKFRECRYITSRVQPRDKLDLLLRDVELHGTFEVGDLPATDAVLLLVFEKRENSPLVAFQSFAFPTSSDSKDAQLAVIDTFKGNASNAPGLLRMEDHITGKEAQTVSKRIEQLNFNHVYAVEEGSYDATIKDRVNEELELRTKKILKLTKSQNYVILRTGEEGTFPESLMVFPDDLQSYGSRLQYSLFSLVASMVAYLMA